MRTLFADTFYFLAMLNPGDESHSAAVGWEAETGVRLVTSAWVLLEVGDALSDSPSRRVLPLLVATLRKGPRNRVVELSRGVFDEALSLFGERPDKRWSLTDCTSFVIMRRLGLRDALTGDRHFEQAGFRALLR